MPTDPESHAAFRDRILAAPKDVSLPIFQDYLGQGYNDTEWMTDPGATDSACLMKNGDHMGLEEFISQTQYDACIFSKSHVGCRCLIKLTGPDLPEVLVGAFGVQA